MASLNPTYLYIYAGLEIALAIHITICNSFVMWAFYRYRQLRTITNTFIFSLALTDFLTGLVGIPLTVFSVLSERPTSYYGCLAIHSSVLTLCTVSIFHLLVMTFDKFLSISCRSQMWKHRRRHRRASILLTWAWVAGIAVGCMPFFGFHGMKKSFDRRCQFLAVVELRYLFYVIFFGTIIVPTILISFCYLSIYRKIRRESTMIRALLHRGERNRRHNQNRTVVRTLLVIVLTFVVCWYPLYTLNAILYYCPECSFGGPVVILCAVVLSHVSCGLNPLLYAFGLPGFRQVFYGFFPCVTNQIPERTRALTTFGFDTMMNSIRRSFPNAIQVSIKRNRLIRARHLSGCPIPPGHEPQHRANSAPNLTTIVESSGLRHSSQAAIEAHIWNECVQL